MKIKCVISAGCSFSQVPNTDVTWPVHVNEALNPEKTYYLGQGAAGNGIISRKIIYAVYDALKTYNSDEILVGVMWSGYDRRELFSYNKELTTIINVGFSNDEYRNPCSVVKKNFYNIINQHWDDELSTNQKLVFRDEDSLMITLEHILRIQWLCKLHGIKYFMTEYDYDVFAPYDIAIKDKLALVNTSADLQFLYSQIDFSHWLPIENMYDYAKFVSTYDFARPPDSHPSTEQHKEMVQKILLPFLKNKYNID